VSLVHPLKEASPADKIGYALIHRLLDANMRPSGVKTVSLYQWTGEYFAKEPKHVV
jgi:hypothetical protein